MGLVKEMIEGVEREGGVCRDDASLSGYVPSSTTSEASDEARFRARGGFGHSEIRWWKNVFEGYVWDGQADDPR